MKKNLLNNLLIAVILFLPTLVSAMEKSEERFTESKYKEMKNAIPSFQEVQRLEKIPEQAEEAAKNNSAIDITDEDLGRLKPQDKKLLSALLEEADFEDIRDILAAGADANIKIKSLTLLQRAISKSDFALVSALLQAGADPNKESYGFSPLDWATIRFLADLDWYQRTRKLLLDKGAEKTPVSEQKLLPTSKPTAVFRPR